MSVCPVQCACVEKCIPPHNLWARLHQHQQNSVVNDNGETDNRQKSECGTNQ